MTTQNGSSRFGRTPSWFRAESLDKAYDKVAVIASEHERLYQNAHGEEVRWVFEGLSELLPI